ncbi:acetaldehyde dehydrogenase (acetylating) [Pseudonocardia bannensis]|uniref:Acetaldehyde dehydrogenase n=1 Tax=Pseudonocardia bannensis TaxID=630973 RepID=A0A848DKD9_9PSEU|nr:acetaldehyde dehydrogenase (acetylating) [Pseudonocardia bannensis]NMH92894.1 acetaldehyde dehydrogenase (acetylating) [Pseudonocardia bannensis]
MDLSSPQAVERPLRVAILGSGNISTDLMYKVRREQSLQLIAMAGIDPGSEGLRRAADLGVPTSADGIDGLFDLDDLPELVFDATSARAHLAHAPRLADAQIASVDLTPAAIGPMVIPAVNGDEHRDGMELNLVSCAAQATVPLVAAVGRAARHLRYAETVSTVASASVGPGTRQNIDEFTHKTRKAIETLGGAERGKAIVILNPAEPPPCMRNTLYAEVDGLDEDLLAVEVARMVQRVEAYVPGYRVRGPVIDGRKVTLFNEVEGAGDFLPTYAGNLDIITAAAVRMARQRVAAGAEARV